MSESAVLHKVAPRASENARPLGLRNSSIWHVFSGIQTKQGKQNETSLKAELTHPLQEGPYRIIFHHLSWSFDFTILHILPPKPYKSMQCKSSVSISTWTITGLDSSKETQVQKQSLPPAPQRNWNHKPRASPFAKGDEAAWFDSIVCAGACVNSPCLGATRNVKLDVLQFISV